MDPDVDHRGVAAPGGRRVPGGQPVPAERLPPRTSRRPPTTASTWTRIVIGIRPSEFTRVIREDPEKRGLLYAGTERGVWVSFNDGASWQSLQLNLPPVPIHDLVVKEGDIVAGLARPVVLDPR